MARRSIPRRLPGLRFQVDGRYALADIVAIGGTKAFIRTAMRPPEDRPVAFQWAGAERHALIARVMQVAEAAPDGRYGIALDLLEVTSQESPDAAVDFARNLLGIEPASDPRAAGASWSLRLTEGAPEPLPVRVAPALRVAGNATTLPSAPLMTGLVATTSDIIAGLLEGLGTKIGMYLNVPCAYWVAGAQYWGRALRISDRWLQVNTNVVVPGLGVRLRCDLTLDIDGERRPVALHGILGRRQENPPGGTYKALLWVTVQTIDEGDSPGLLAHWLERTFRERRDGPETDAE